MKRRADFGIINFWWCDDHGAILTAYALQTFISKMGYSSELLKCFSSYDDTKRIGGISENFEKKHLKSSSDVYRTYEDIYEAKNNKYFNDGYIGFITGSDQVFRPEYVPDSWFLSFVSNNRAKIAVAASFGTDTFICDNKARTERIAESLKSFDYISIREDSGIRICKEEFGVDAVHLLDPVFLVNRSEYDSIISSASIDVKDDFIFCYVRDVNQHTKDLIDKMKNKYNLEVVFCNEKMPVEDFLYYISKCTYMITDSYHGMCFSIIYNKNYLCIRNTMRGKARFESLQKQLELQTENFIDENMSVDNIPLIDYRNTNSILYRLSEKDSEWLSNILKESYMKYK